MARTIYPALTQSGKLSITSSSIRQPRSAGSISRVQPVRTLDTQGEKEQQERERTADEQSYLERVQNYIPAEIVALFIFVNSLIAKPVDENQDITADGWVAVGSVGICIAACFIFARVAAKQVDNPAFRLQGWMFVIALLIWIYAMDAKVLQVFGLEPIPALSGLLLVTFTMFSGLLVPAIPQPDEQGDGRAGDGQDPASPQMDVSNLGQRGVVSTNRSKIMSNDENHFCMCLRNKPGLAPIEGAERAAVLREAQWIPGTAISVTFLSGSESLKARVRAVAEEWVAPGMANLSFNWVDDVEANIRIAFMPGKGSWSYLGTVCRQIDSPDPTMNYGWLTDASGDDELRRVVLHEFGHALGLIHEHQNPEGGIAWNEAAVIDDLSGPPNNWDLATIKTNVLNKYDKDAVNSTKMDPESIMMYPIPASWTDGVISVGLNGDLSKLDKELIQEVYS